MRPVQSERSRPQRFRLRPALEQLETRVLLAARVHTVGPIIAPAVVNPRVNHPPIQQTVQAAINNYLAAVLGEDSLLPIQRKVHAQQAGERTVLAQRVLQQPFVDSLFGNRDTYTLLNSPAVGELIGVQVVSDTLVTDATVRYLLPDANAILSLDASTATVQIPPNGDVDGFIAEVPIANVRLRADGVYVADVPRDQIPANAPAPLTINVVTGQLQATYQETGPILSNALLTGAHRRTPNTPRSVPGLRLSRLLGRNGAFPFGAVQRRMVRQLRVAVTRDVMDPTNSQRAQISAALSDFLIQVNALNQGGVFTPATPPAAPMPVRGPLTGSLVITVGAFRDLAGVPAALRGLPLGEVTDSEGNTQTVNLPGRIDVGYAIDRAGNYGIVLTARGPLRPSQPEFATENTIGGDVRIEVASARQIQNLGGLRIEEGLTVGAALSSTLGMSNSNGVQTWSSSVGYGSGFQYGTSVAFTTVIPLGNVNALLPQFPPN